MPRSRKSDVLGALRAKATSVLQQLDGQIQKLEAEIAELREEGARWRAVVGGTISHALNVRRGPGRPRGSAAARKARHRGSARVNWDEVLSSVPTRFGVQDVMKHPGAAAKGRAQVYPALNRWGATKRIKRVEQGVYEKLSSGSLAAVRRAKRGSGKKRAAAKRDARKSTKRGRPAKVVKAV